MDRLRVGFVEDGLFCQPRVNDAMKLNELFVVKMVSGGEEWTGVQVFGVEGGKSAVVGRSGLGVRGG